MMKSLFFFPLLALSVLFAGCTGPESPQEVSEAFWQAVLKADANDASEYSTLVDEAAFDSFERNWDNVQVEWGRVVIDDHLATVATTLSGVKGREEALETVTYLVQKNGDWLVDYYRTGDALKTDPLWGGIVGQLERLGQDIKARWAQQSSQVASELEALGQELQLQATQANEQFTVLVEEYGELLEHHIGELSSSLKEALKAHPDASAADKRAINEAVNRLDEQSQALETPDFQALAESARVTAETQLELADLDEEFVAYKAEWQQRVVEIEAEIAEFLRRLSGQ